MLRCFNLLKDMLLTVLAAQREITFQLLNFSVRKPQQMLYPSWLAKNFKIKSKQKC